MAEGREESTESARQARLEREKKEAMAYIDINNYASQCQRGELRSLFLEWSIVQSLAENRTGNFFELNFGFLGFLNVTLF